MVKFLAAAVAAAALVSSPAWAGDLIVVHDGNPAGANSIFLTDQAVAAVKWTQTTSAHNVSLDVVMSDFGASQVLSWWVTTALGPSATAADVVASGNFLIPNAGPVTAGHDFGGTAWVNVTTGLNLGAGDYYLLIQGAHDETAKAEDMWSGDVDTSVDTAAGFTLDGSFIQPGPGSQSGPALNRDVVSADQQLAFRMTGDVSSGAPEPGVWALMLIGFGAAGAALRRRTAAA